MGRHLGVAKRKVDVKRLAFIPPMMPTLVDRPPMGDDWSTEIKFDGWRCQIVIDADGVRVFTRNGHDWTKQLKPIANAASTELDVYSAIIDGELVYPQESGRSDFHALQAVVRSQPEALIFMAFDLLHLNGEDWREKPLVERRAPLHGMIRPGGRIQYSEALLGEPFELFALAEQMELEGIVCKRKGSAYGSGNTINWLKVKTFTETEFEFLGVQRDHGKPTMALMGEIGTRKYLGGAFVTFGRHRSDDFKAFVEGNLGPPVDIGKKVTGTVQWLRPGIIGRVKHLRGEDKLRHARLVDFRM
jgi:bifunctional non-homologous end joining protein LigD